MKKGRKRSELQVKRKIHAMDPNQIQKSLKAPEVRVEEKRSLSPTRHWALQAFFSLFFLPAFSLATEVAAAVA